MTELRFPAEIAVGEVEWEDAREPSGWGHLLAIGLVEVPDRTAIRLKVHAVAEVSVSAWERRSLVGGPGRDHPAIPAPATRS